MITRSGKWNCLINQQTIWIQCSEEHIWKRMSPRHTCPWKQGLWLWYCETTLETYTVKDFRKKKSNHALPTSQKKKLNIDIGRNCWSAAFTATKETRLRTLQWKTLHEHFPEENWENRFWHMQCMSHKRERLHRFFWFFFFKLYIYMWQNKTNLENHWQWCKS